MTHRQQVTEATLWVLILSCIVAVMLVAMTIAATNGRTLDAGALLFGSVLSIVFLFGCAYQIGERP